MTQLVHKRMTVNYVNDKRWWQQWINSSWHCYLISSYFDFIFLFSVLFLVSPLGVWIYLVCSGVEFGSNARAASAATTAMDLSGAESGSQVDREWGRTRNPARRSGPMRAPISNCTHNSLSRRGRGRHQRWPDPWEEVCSMNLVHRKTYSGV